LRSAWQRDGSADLCSEGLGRLDRGDRATAKDPIVRYVRDRPGKLVHVDVRKLAAVPDGGGHRIRGRGYPGQHARRRVGCRFIQSALDDRSRLVCSEVFDDERAVTAAGFGAGSGLVRLLRRRPRRTRSHRQRVVLPQQPMAPSLDRTGTVRKRTRAYRIQTNGKIERFHRILLEEWAYIRHWATETKRQHAYTGFIHYYNHHRSHGGAQMGHPSLNPQRASTLNENLPEEHTLRVVY